MDPLLDHLLYKDVDTNVSFFHILPWRNIMGRERNQQSFSPPTHFPDFKKILKSYILSH